jgi:Spy/CpxP family protein refolding chaperone
MKTRTKIMVFAGLVAITLWGGSVLAAPQNSQGGPPANGPGQGNPGMRPMAGGPGMGGGAPGMGQGSGGPDGMMAAIMHKLDLTDEQREKVETIIDENHAKTRAAQRAVEKARKALEEATAAAVGTAIGDEAVLKVKTMKDIKAVLTPEQIKKLDELKTQMKSRTMRPMQDNQGGQRPRPQTPPPSAPDEQ